MCADGGLEDGERAGGELVFLMLVSILLYCLTVLALLGESNLELQDLVLGQFIAGLVYELTRSKSAMFQP